jgi:hypothetical protein
MKIEIYDPPMCCPSGVCGPSVDPKLVQLQETLRRIEKAGAEVKRFNLSGEPQAFVDNATVAALLRDEGNGALPVTLADGEILAKGRYPENTEFEEALKAAGIALEAPPQKAKACCGPGCC